MKPWLVALCLLLASCTLTEVQASPDPMAMGKGKKALVLFFVATDCPISNAYAPEIKRICARYSPENIAFRLVYPDPGTSLAQAQKHVKDYGYACPLVLDPLHRLAHKARATVTPEAAVFAPSGRLLYEGRIDNAFVGYGQRRYNVTAHELLDALDAILSGKPVRTPRTQAIGCFI